MTRTVMEGQPDIARRRMHGQRLWGEPLANPEAVVARLGALQSQEFSIAKWSVAQRTTGAGESAMDRLFARGAILRTHVLRPTWHFVLPADIRWLLRLTGPRVNARSAPYYSKLELGDDVLAKSNRVIAKAVEDTHLTRKEISQVLDRSGIEASSLRLGYILMHAELNEVICSGAMRGKKHTYASVAERAPNAITLDRDEALAELTGRYFSTRGPATLKDYSWWSTLTMADCRTGVGMIASQLESETVDGRTYWYAPITPAIEIGEDRIDLVQGYDECIVSYSESKDVLGRDALAFGFRDRPVFIHAVLLNGRLIGHWRRRPRAKSFEIETFFYRPLKRGQQRLLEAAVERLSLFMGRSATPASPSGAT